MHTEPSDPNGPNLVANINMLGLTIGEVQFSTQKLDFPDLAALYNIADVTVCISDAEGCGLSTLESLSCGTPIIVNMTGGLQEQVTDGEEWFGVGIDPCSKAVIGSQEIPYIFEDRINKDKFIDARPDNKTEKEEEGADAKEREGFGVEGMDETGREYAFQVFKNRGVRQSIIDGYKNLKNDKDRKLFKDRMMINLNLYLKKFEEENFGQPDYEIPDNPEALDEKPPMGGEGMPPEPDMGGEMMPPEDEEVIPPPSFE